MKVGLRIDLDTYNGTRDGFPALLADLEPHGARASFFFSVGPDNMGRHLWRLLKPRFLAKMIRSNAAGLYGPEILLRGAFWPGPSIRRILRPVLCRQARDLGHELGLHAWDHRAWQARAGKLSLEDIHLIMRRGLDALAEVAGTNPDSFAAPSWKGTESLFEVEKEVGLRYASDCRGSGNFRPRLGGGEAGVPQVPVSLPTYDEVIGTNGIRDENYNRFVLESIAETETPVLTVHAEVEGVARRELFRDFLGRATARGIRFVPLGDLLPADPLSLPLRTVQRGEIPGREGWVALA